MVDGVVNNRPTRRRSSLLSTPATVESMRRGGTRMAYCASVDRNALTTSTPFILRFSYNLFALLTTLVVSRLCVCTVAVGQDAFHARVGVDGRRLRVSQRLCAQRCHRAADERLCYLLPAISRHLAGGQDAQERQRSLLRHAGVPGNSTAAV